MNKQKTAVDLLLDKITDYEMGETLLRLIGKDEIDHIRNVGREQLRSAHLAGEKLSILTVNKYIDCSMTLSKITECETNGIPSKGSEKYISETYNKQPKEIFICGNKLDNIYLLEKMSIYDIKYISEAHHNEMVEVLKEGISKLQEQFDENGGNLPPLIQLQRISANVSDIIKNYFEENKLLKAEIESLKSKAESKRKHWNTK